MSNMIRTRPFEIVVGKVRINPFHTLRPRLTLVFSYSLTVGIDDNGNHIPPSTARHSAIIKAINTAQMKNIPIS
jgi:hypothetical protein